MSFRKSFKTSFNRSFLTITPDAGVPATGLTAVFALGGQSNSGFGKIPLASVPAISSKVREWSKATSAFVNAHDPLEHNNWYRDADRIGPYVKFAKLYANATGHKVVLLSHARGGTGFTNAGGGDVWDYPSGQLCLDMYAKHTNAWNALIAAGETPFMAGILFCQGEQDTGNPTYITELDTFYKGIRGESIGSTPLLGVTATTPIVHLNLNDDYYVQSVGRDGIREILADLPKRLAYCAVIDNTGTLTNDDVYGDGDKTHISGQGHLNNANRILSALSIAQLNTSAVGTNLRPQCYYTPTTNYSAGIIDIYGFKTGGGAYLNPWYNPQPTTYQWRIYKADDASGLNETQVTSFTDNGTVHHYAYTLPAADNKFYYGALYGANSKGNRLTYTSNKYQNV